MSKTFFIADLHLGDENILRYEGRPFASVDSMNKTMIRNWNSVVSEEDVIFVVGDFISDLSYLPLIDELKGSIKLIVGNHDIPFIKEFRNYKGIEVIDYPIILDGFWMISHEPMYVSENMPYANIFGHIHSNPMYLTVSSRSYCVCVERNNFTPVDFEYIKERVRKENHK